jgi:hypothetical protein
MRQQLARHTTWLVAAAIAEHGSQQQCDVMYQTRECVCACVHGRSRRNTAITQ